MYGQHVVWTEPGLPSGDAIRPVTDAADRRPPTVAVTVRVCVVTLDLGRLRPGEGTGQHRSCRLRGAMSGIVRKSLAEFVGTAILVFFGVGAAVFGIDKIGPLGVALTFGLLLLALAYAIGPTSGCHINPAVTLGVLLSRGITRAEAGAYWCAQILGGIVAAALLKGMTTFGHVADQTGSLGANGWGAAVSGPGAFVIEAALTFLLVFVVLHVTGRAAAPGFAGLAIGLTLTAAILAGLPLTGASINPARSIGPALFAGPLPLFQLWLFVAAPLVGGALAALIVPRLAPVAVQYPTNETAVRGAADLSFAGNR